MAFNRSDTDFLYEKQIKPVLRRNRVTPVIINRRQSNDDLNNQIIEELKKCDFCIADLTYTRPSVYFEAGYAQRQVEVIYTVRTDHLDRNATDNARVHFDLQMKPLITWKRPDDPSFGKELEKRLKATALRTWQSKQKAYAAKSRAEQQFATMPVYERIRLLQRVATTLFSNMGFGDWKYMDWDWDWKRDKKIKVHDLRTGNANFVQAIRIQGKSFQYVSVQSFANVTKHNLEDLRRFHRYYNIKRILPEAGQPINRILTNNVVLCLEKIPARRIESIFNDFGGGLKHGYYKKIESYTLSLPTHITCKIEFDQNWYFIGPIRSRSELDASLQEFRERIG